MHRSAPDARAGFNKFPASIVPPDAEPAALIREAYLRVVGRPPTEQERTRCLRYFGETATTAEALGDIVWALLNTQEFITNH